MTMFLSLLLILTFVLCLAMIVGDGLLRQRTAWRDFVWRASLIAVATLPVMFLVRHTLPSLSIDLALLPPTSQGERHVTIEGPSGATSSRALANPTVSRDDLGALDALPGNAVAMESLSTTLASDSSPGRAAAAAGALSATTTSGAGTNHVGNQPFWLAALTWSWLTGTAIYLLWLAAGFWRLHRLTRAARRVTQPDVAAQAAAACRQAGLDSPVEIVVSRCVTMPVVAGFLRPRIVLPDGWWEQTPVSCRAEILLHEARHIARGDLWTVALQHLVTASTLR